MGKYSERCEAEGIVFIPLVVDRFGGWHKDSLEVITKLGRHTEMEEEEIMRQLKYLEGLVAEEIFLSPLSASFPRPIPLHPSLHIVPG